MKSKWNYFRLVSVYAYLLITGKGCLDGPLSSAWGKEEFTKRYSWLVRPWHMDLNSLKDRGRWESSDIFNDGLESRDILVKDELSEIMNSAELVQQNRIISEETRESSMLLRWIHARSNWVELLRFKAGIALSLFGMLLMFIAYIFKWTPVELLYGMAVLNIYAMYKLLVYAERIIQLKKQFIEGLLMIELPQIERRMKSEMPDLFSRLNAKRESDAFKKLLFIGEVRKCVVAL